MRMEFHTRKYAVCRSHVFPFSWRTKSLIEKLVVDDRGIGRNLCDRVKPVRRAEIAEKINRLMSANSGRLKNEIKKVSQTLEDARILT